MSLFVRGENENNYTAEINGIQFVCDAVKPEYEGSAAVLADVYIRKLPQIVEFMLDDINAMFGDISAVELTDALGIPQIDLDRNMVTFLEHTLDQYHIINVEYGGLLDEFYEVIIDG